MTSSSSGDRNALHWEGHRAMPSPWITSCCGAAAGSANLLAALAWPRRRTSKLAKLSYGASSDGAPCLALSKPDCRCVDGLSHSWPDRLRLCGCSQQRLTLPAGSEAYVVKHMSDSHQQASRSPVREESVGFLAAPYLVDAHLFPPRVSAGPALQARCSTRSCVPAQASTGS